MGKGMKYPRTNARGTEEASPKGREPVPLRGGSHVAPGKVRTWADMSPAERARVVASIRPPGIRE